VACEQDRPRDRVHTCSFSTSSNQLDTSSPLTISPVRMLKVSAPGTW
jgi:hypothetical protein